MKQLIRRFRGVLIAIAALALSAGLAFGAQPEGNWGLTNASAHAGKTVPVRAGQQEEDTGEDVDEDLEDEDDVEEDVDEDVEDPEDVEDAGEGGGGENCTDPTTLTPEALADVKHGSIVCWAAHQDDWPDWFTNHGKHVKCWAHSKKAEAPSCTEDPNAEAPEIEEDAAATSTGKGQGKSQGKGKGHNK